MVGIAWFSGGSGRWSGEGQRCQKVGGEDQEGGDGSQVFEEPTTGPHLLHRPAPQIFSEIADGMESESQKVQGDEHGGKIDFPVSEIVLEIVSVVLQDVEAFMVSRPEGFHLRPLSERCGSLSTHTAPIKQTRQPFHVASVQTDAVGSPPPLPGSGPPASCAP